jgi:hypothetical protein
MLRSMPVYIVLHHGNEIARISAVSYRQAMKRAARFGRVEVIASGNVDCARDDNRTAGVHNVGKVGGRKPYATPGFDARVAALREAAGI